MLILTCLLAFYLAWNLGANDVANSMGTSVGSKAVTLRQALIIAGVLEFTGAVLFGQNVSETLVTQIVNPEFFGQTPQIFLTGMLAVLVASGLWINLATAFGLPVSSSHAVVGAIAGFGWAAVGFEAVDWPSIRTITLTWILTPLLSGAIAALFYTIIKRFILDQPHPLQQLQEWIPWLSTALFSIFGVIVLPSFSQPIQRFLSQYLGILLPSHTILLGMGAIASVGLTFVLWGQLGQAIGDQGSGIGNREANGEPPWVIRHGSLAEDKEQRTKDEKIQNPESKIQNLSPSPELLLARFQLLSACFVAFAHGSNDVGNAIAPLAAIVATLQTGTVPIDSIQIPLWVLVLGGTGIVVGLAVWGKRVITTVGENIIALQPSGGMCAELATATTALLASQAGLPVSTSHALVGGVVGVGLAQAWKTVELQTVRTIGLTWIATIPAAIGLGALTFRLFSYWLP
ncbi:MAG TPA: inorganic phosphate transporter [Leptolyngbyaceae cyanobacterium M65_K2018_010]|nr:inorganic phosphate transporter [Leptolyngbyaceae cyanobacterium M65_K2018_010]